MKEIMFNPEQIGQFAQYLRQEERSEKTVEKYVRDLRCFAAFIGQEAVNKQSIIAYKSYLAERYAVTSANSMIAALNSFLRYCGRQDLCIKQFKLQRQAFCPEEKELSREEYVRLLKAAQEKQKNQLHLIIQTICGTGIRVSELEYITVEAVMRGEAVVSCKGKNRRIFIVSALKKKLLRFAKERKICAGPVFITRNGTPISRHYIWKEMKSLCRLAGVEASKVFPHNLRHLFARTFYGIEKDIAKLADILGHASINTTRIYIVTTGAEHRQKMEHMRLII